MGSRFTVDYLATNTGMASVKPDFSSKFISFKSSRFAIAADMLQCACATYICTQATRALVFISLFGKEEHKYISVFPVAE